MRIQKVAAVLAIFVLTCCSRNPADPGKQPADWMALTARIKGFRQIVLVHVHDPSGFKVMLLDLETGSVREFVKPKNIRGATSLRFPDY